MRAELYITSVHYVSSAIFFGRRRLFSMLLVHSRRLGSRITAHRLTRPKAFAAGSLQYGDGVGMYYISLARCVFILL